MSAQSESTRYRSHAGRNYTPPGPPGDPWGPYIKEASSRYDVPEKWIREVMRQESGGNLYNKSGELITSGAGAMGLMQVMPATFDEIRGRYAEIGDDPYDPHNNILAGTAYVREMYDIYGAPGFLAAYNAGPGRLDDYLTRNRTLPMETKRYVAAIGPRIAGYTPTRASPGEQYAMNGIPAVIPTGTRYAASARYTAPAATGNFGGSGTGSFQTASATYAPAAPTPVAPYIVLNPPRAAAPAPIQAPVQMAQLPEPPRAPSAAPYIVLRPQPQPVEVAEAPEPPAAPPPPVQVAQLPEPPRYTPPPLSQRQMASAALVPAAPGHHGTAFGFIPAANAEPVGIRRSGVPQGGNWSIQVGAYANEGMASAATTAARDHARDVLASARGTVTTVKQGHATLYRARLNGLSRDAAAQACEKLVRARTNCMVVSPDAQS